MIRFATARLNSRDRGTVITRDILRVDIVRSAQAHDAVLQSLDTRPPVDGGKAAAFWVLDSGRSGGQGGRNHDSIESAVDAVIALLERT